MSNLLFSGDDWNKDNKKTRPTKRKKKVIEKERLDQYIKDNKGKDYEMKKASEM